MKVRGNQLECSSPSHNTSVANPTLPSIMIAEAPRVSRTCGSEATPRKTVAAMARPTSQKLMAFSGSLGVTKGGMPLKESVWARSTTRMATKPAPIKA